MLTTPAPDTRTLPASMDVSTGTEIQRSLFSKPIFQRIRAGFSSGNAARFFMFVFCVRAFFCSLSVHRIGLSSFPLEPYQRPEPAHTTKWIAVYPFEVITYSAKTQLLIGGWNEDQPLSVCVYSFVFLDQLFRGASRA